MANEPEKKTEIENKSAKDEDLIIEEKEKEEKEKRERQQGQKEKTAWDKARSYSISLLHYTDNAGLFLLAAYYKHEQFRKDKQEALEKYAALDKLKDDLNSSDPQSSIQAGEDTPKIGVTFDEHADPEEIKEQLLNAVDEINQSGEHQHNLKVKEREDGEGLIIENISPSQLEKLQSNDQLRQLGVEFHTMPTSAQELDQDLKNRNFKISN